MRYHYTVSTQKNVSTLAADTEFGSTIIPASFSRKPVSLANAFNSLLVLQDIVRVTSLCRHDDYEEGKIFFSTLSSICTVSDFILRKLRGFLMVLSLDCTKLELIAEGNDKSLPNKSKGKPGACNRKKKGKTRNMERLNAVPGSCLDILPSDKSLKVFFFFSLLQLLAFFYSTICFDICMF